MNRPSGQAPGDRSGGCFNVVLDTVTAAAVRARARALGVPAEQVIAQVVSDQCADVADQAAPLIEGGLHG